jgi:glutamyl-tRNA reductase
MKQLPDENYEDWIKRSQLYEYGRALQQLADGGDPAKILEEMGNRLTKKMIHPILTAINKLPTLDYNAEESRRHYKENYLDNVPKAADHIANEDNGHVHKKD